MKGNKGRNEGIANGVTGEKERVEGLGQGTKWVVGVMEMGQERMGEAERAMKRLDGVTEEEEAKGYESGNQEGD